MALGLYEALAKAGNDETKFFNLMTDNGKTKLSDPDFVNAKKIFHLNNKVKNENDKLFGDKAKGVASSVFGDLSNLSSIGGEKGKLSANLSGVFDLLGQLATGQLSVMDTIKKMAVTANESYLDKITKSYEEINESGALTGRLADEFRVTLIDAGINAERLGIGFNELSAAVGSLVTKSGKFKVLDESAINDMSLASKFVTNGIQGFSDLASETEKYSMGVQDTASEVTKMMKSSIESGLNYKKVIDGVSGSLEKLNMYGFKNGIQGLADMSKKAIEFRMNMESTFSLAEKVWSPEDSIKLSANLQMIGGAVGDLNDPLKLMYMSTNNVEGLQDSLINAAKGLATYNEEQGRFVVTGANLRRAKEMADAMGVSMQELNKISIAAAERTSAAGDLMSSGLQMKDEDKEFLTNMSRMEGGKMIINITSPDLVKELGGMTKVTLDSLTSSQANTILKYREELKDMSPIEVAKQQVSFVKNIDRNLAYIVASAQAQMGREELKAAKEILKIMGFDMKGFVGGIENKITQLHNEMPEYVNKLNNEVGKVVGQVTGKQTDVNKNKKSTLTKEAILNKDKENNTNSQKSVNINQNVTHNFRSFDAINDSIERAFKNSSEYSRIVLDNNSYLKGTIS